MRHHSRRELSEKQNAPNMQNSNRRAKVKPCKTGISAPLHSSVCSNNKTAKQYNVAYKTKRLKSIKQRNQIRRQSSNRFNQHHQYFEGKCKDKSRCSDYQDCQCSCSLHFSKKERSVARSFPSQKPSIITEGRLTSIRGLFSHEVRSVDIERLVKEKKHQTHVEKEKERQATASNSTSFSCVIPHSTPPAVVSETSEEGISACANKDQRSQTKPDQSQTNLEDTVPVSMHSADVNHSHTQTPKATDNDAGLESPPDHKVMYKAVIMSPSESDPVHNSFSTSFKISQSGHKIILKKKNQQKQTNKVTAAGYVQDDVNSERLVTSAGLEASNLDVTQFDPHDAPTIFLLSSPTLDGKKHALKEESQHRKPVFSSKEETVRRLGARLCQNLGPFPLQRSCPLLTDCRNVLLHHLQKQHGTQLQHSLRKIHSKLCAEGPQFPHTAGQDWSSTVQKYSEKTQMSFSYTRKQKDDQQSKTREFQRDNSPPKHYLREGFCENVDRGEAPKRQRKQTWGIYSPQDFVTKLQRPCKDTLSQWSITAHSPESLRAKQHSKSQTSSLNQTFTRSQTPPWSYSCTNQILDPFIPEPQKQVKLGSDETSRRNSTALPLLEQWRNDPDLNFLFQDETSQKTPTSLGPLAELRIRSPDHDIESISERQFFGASSFVSSFCPQKGFCYEPYYRFPHSSNSFNRSEKSRMSLSTSQPDVEMRGYGSSLHLTSPYFWY